MNNNDESYVIIVILEAIFIIGKKVKNNDLFLEKRLRRQLVLEFEYYCISLRNLYECTNINQTLYNYLVLLKDKAY